MLSCVVKTLFLKKEKKIKKKKKEWGLKIDHKVIVCLGYPISSRKDSRTMEIPLMALKKAQPPIQL